jgi:hypothetical protein
LETFKVQQARQAQQAQLVQPVLVLLIDTKVHITMVFIIQ